MNDICVAAHLILQAQEQLTQLQQQLHCSQAQSKKLTEQLQTMQQQTETAAAAGAAALAAAAEGTTAAEAHAAEAGRKMAAADGVIEQLQQQLQQQLKAHQAEVTALKVRLDHSCSLCRRRPCPLAFPKLPFSKLPF